MSEAFEEMWDVIATQATLGDRLSAAVLPAGFVPEYEPREVLCWGCDAPLSATEGGYCGDCYASLPKCKDCGDAITGCSWSGRCLDCHEGSLLPETAEDRWQDHYSA